MNLHWAFESCDDLTYTGGIQGGVVRISVTGVGMFYPLIF